MSDVVLDRSRLLAAMTLRGWTQVHLAKEMKVAQSTVSRVLSGTMEPGAELTGKLLRATGLHYDELFRPYLQLVPQYMTTKEVAKLLGVSRRHVQLLVRRRELAALHLGSRPNAPLRFTEAEVARYMSTMRYTEATEAVG